MSVSTPDAVAVVDIPEITRSTRFEDLPELLTAREAAVLLKVSPWTVYQSIERNQIPCVKVGRKKLYVPRSYFLDLLKTA